jgi:hypothetical protein
VKLSSRGFATSSTHVPYRVFVVQLISSMDMVIVV